MKHKPQNAKGGFATVAEAAAKCRSAIVEPKYDGWRMVAEITESGPRLYSRNDKEYTGRLPEVEAELAKLPVGTILDGEIVSLSDQDCTRVTNVVGKSVTVTSQQERDYLTYVAFDVLEYAGVSAINEPLSARRHVLEQALFSFELDDTRVQAAAQLPASEESYTDLVEAGWEGVIVKCLDAKYAPGKRGHGFWKMKAQVDIDVVVMGMELDGKGQHQGKVGRFIVGQYVDGELVERAKVNPYDDEMRTAMTQCVKHAERTNGTNAFIGQVCTIKHYGTLHAEGSDEVTGLRHPVFQTWREDKLAAECTYHNE